MRRGFFSRKLVTPGVPTCGTSARPSPARKEQVHLSIRFPQCGVIEACCKHGQLLFVDPSRPPARGDDVVIQVMVGDTMCGFVKRFIAASDEKTTVRQFNPDEEIVYPTTDVTAVHLIVGSLAAGR